MARPKKKIDQKLFENLCALQCSQEEICSVLDVCTETLNSWCKRTYKQGFSEVFRQKRGKGKISLRRTQWELAKHSPAMAIYLGKNILGQSDNPIEDELNRLEIERKKIEVEKEKLEYERAKIELDQIRPVENQSQSNFIEAMNQLAAKVWSDE